MFYLSSLANVTIVGFARWVLSFVEEECMCSAQAKEEEEAAAYERTGVPALPSERAEGKGRH